MKNNTNNIRRRTGRNRAPLAPKKKKMTALRRQQVISQPTLTNQITPMLMQQESSLHKTEIKYHDTILDSSLATTATRFDLCAVPLGNRMYERIGSTISVKSLEVSAYVQLGDPTNLVRVVVIQWHNDGTLTGTPSWGDIFNTAGVTNPRDICGFYNRSLRSRDYTVLEDIMARLDAGYTNCLIRFTINEFTHLMTFADGNTTGFNHLYMLIISDSGVVTHPAINGYSRVYFID